MSKNKNDNNATSISNIPIQPTWERPDGASAFHVGSSVKLFVSIRTSAFVWSNYRGRVEGNINTLQMVTVGEEMYPVVGPAALRNGLREGLSEEIGHENMNGYRLHNQGQPARGFRGPCGEIEAADDVIFGYLRSKDLDVCLSRGILNFARSVIAVNYGLGLSTIKQEYGLQQAPVTVDRSGAANQNATHSSLLEPQFVHTAFQFVFAVDTFQLQAKYRDAAVGLIRTLCQFANVAGNHARTYFDMSPESVMGRVTKARTPQFNTYAWTEQGENTEIARLNENDLLHPKVCPNGGKEWYIGGKIVRDMPTEERQRLIGLGVNLFESPQACLLDMIEKAIPEIEIVKAA